MKLTTFTKNNCEYFGFELENKIYPFSNSENAGKSNMLWSMQSFLEHFPKSRVLAESILDEAKQGILKGFEIKDVKIESPIKPTMLLDFALTPRHLLNSALTFVEHEYSGLKKVIAKHMVQKKVLRMQANKQYPYYKANHHAIIGNNDTVLWPNYTSYLDIEPELAIIIGAGNTIAGYTIFNDFSARDVQVPELNTLSLTKSKDFRTGNGFGPFAVTCDEIETPQSLQVDIKIGNRLHWKGNTNEYSVSPQAIVNYVTQFMDIAPGTVIGMGTIPYCCCLDNNLWINPGETIEISFEGIGTLIQHFPQNIPQLQKSRWKQRKELDAFIAKI